MAELPPPHVMIVQGPASPAELLERQLTARRYRVTSLVGGEEALARVRAERPDAVLLDSDLPGLDGMAVLDRMRADDELAAIPVIMLTRNADRERLLEALRRGAHDSVHEPFDPAELDARIAAALRVKRLHDALVEANQRLAQQALTDELTGLANRRHGAHELDRAVALAVRHGRLLGLVRVDVDQFKQINDTYGHQAGDEVLAEVARRLAGAIRGGDELARWGGDEFVAILPDTDREGSLRTAERLRAAVAAAPVAVPGAEVPVTVSAGWAHWSGDTPDDLLVRADRALYEAKDAGRDMVRPLPR